MICAGGAEPIRHLEELGRELTARGWITSLRSQQGSAPPSLYVQNPEPGATAPRLTEPRLPE